MRRTRARDPYVIVPNVNLPAGVVIAEEVGGRKHWNGVFFVVDACNGHVLRVDIVRKGLVSDLRRHVRTGEALSGRIHLHGARHIQCNELPRPKAGGEAST